MPFDPDKLLALAIPLRVQEYNWRDSVLYALGLGFGLDPTDERQLRFVDETRLAAVPTMANVLAHPGFWMRDLDTGIDWVKVLHGEQRMQLHRPLPVEGKVLGQTRVVEVVDKGPGKGALVNVERLITDVATGDLLATLLQTVLCRGDGGFSGLPPAPPAAPVMSLQTAPDHSIDLPIGPQQALVYRLSGDLNPLHSDPAVARRAGYDRPIFHGLGTFGVAGHALLATLCDYQPQRVRSLKARFSAPVFPGETVTVDIWKDGDGGALFSARVQARHAQVLANGVFTYEVSA